MLYIFLGSLFNYPWIYLIRRFRSPFHLLVLLHQQVFIFFLLTLYIFPLMSKSENCCSCYKQQRNQSIFSWQESIRKLQALSASGPVVKDSARHISQAANDFPVIIYPPRKWKAVPILLDFDKLCGHRFEIGTYVDNRYSIGRPWRVVVQLVFSTVRIRHRGPLSTFSLCSYDHKINKSNIEAGPLRGKGSLNHFSVWSVWCFPWSLAEARSTPWVRDHILCRQVRTLRSATSDRSPMY